MNFWTLHAVGRWLLTGIIAVVFGVAGSMLLTGDHSGLKVVTPADSHVRGSGFESGNQGVDTNKHRYVTSGASGETSSSRGQVPPRQPGWVRQSKVA